MVNNDEIFIDKYVFECLGELTIDYSRLSVVKYSPDLKVDKKIHNQTDMIYLWVIPKEDKKKIIYVGETRNSVKHRWNQHERAFTELLNQLGRIRNETLNKVRIIQLLNNDGNNRKKQRQFLTLMTGHDAPESVYVYAKKAKQQEIMGVNVSLRHAEEQAIMDKFDPKLNNIKPIHNE